MTDSNLKTSPNKFARYSPRPSSNGRVPTPPVQSVSSTPTPPPSQQANTLLSHFSNEQSLTAAIVSNSSSTQPNKFSRYSPPSAMNGHMTSSPTSLPVLSSVPLPSLSKSASPTSTPGPQQQSLTVVPITTSLPGSTPITLPALPQSAPTPQPTGPALSIVTGQNAIVSTVPTTTFSRYSQRNSSTGRASPSADHTKLAKPKSAACSVPKSSQNSANTDPIRRLSPGYSNPKVQPQTPESDPMLLQGQHMQPSRTAQAPHPVHQSHSKAQSLQLPPIQSQPQSSQTQSSHSEQAKPLPQEQAHFLTLAQQNSQSQKPQKKPRKKSSRLESSREKKSKEVSSKSHTLSKQSKQQRRPHPPRPPGQRRRTVQKKLKPQNSSIVAQPLPSDGLPIPASTTKEVASKPNQNDIDRSCTRVSIPSNATLISKSSEAPSSADNGNPTVITTQSFTNRTEHQRAEQFEADMSVPLPVLTPLKSSPYSDNQGQTAKVSDSVPEQNKKVIQHQSQSEQENGSFSSQPSPSGSRLQIQRPIAPDYPESFNQNFGPTSKAGSDSQTGMDDVQPVIIPPQSSHEGCSNTNSPSLTTEQPTAKRQRRPESSSSSHGTSSRNIPEVVTDDVDGDAVALKSTCKESHANKSKQLRRRQISWYDTLRLIWPFLCDQFEGRNRFTFQEICQSINDNWSEVRSEDPPKNNRWRSSLMKCIRTGGIVTKVESGNDGDEEFAMQDSNLGPSKAGTVPKLVKRGDMTDVDEVLPDEGALQRAVPSELFVEATGPVRLSEFDKARRVKFVGPPLENTVEGFKGYRSVRATTGVCEGDWYFEAKVVSSSGDGAVRLGWSMRRSEIETPVGYDQYGFGIRDLTGEFIHKARRIPYGKAFGKGDVIGCRIVLPSLTESEKRANFVSYRRWLEYKYLRFSQGPHPPTSGVNIVNRAYIEFFRNGESMGVPSFFRAEGDYVRLDGSTDKVELPVMNSSENLQNSSSEQLLANSSNAAGSVTSGSTSNSAELTSGALDERAPKRRRVSANSSSSGETSNTLQSIDERRLGILKREMNVAFYYPTVSLYEDIRVQANFGPTFAYPPPKGSRAMCEAAPDPLSSGAQGIHTSNNQIQPAKQDAPFAADKHVEN